jgi:hypothetical protein
MLRVMRQYCLQIGTVLVAVAYGRTGLEDKGTSMSQAQSGYGVGLNIWVDSPTNRAALGIESDDMLDPGFHSISGSFVAGVEYFVAVVEDATSVAVYTDGMLLAQLPVNRVLVASSAPLHLGCHNDDVGYGGHEIFQGPHSRCASLQAVFGRDRDRAAV